MYHTCYKKTGKTVLQCNTKQTERKK